MTDISGPYWGNQLKETAENSFSESPWPIYEESEYELHGTVGSRYISTNLNSPSIFGKTVGYSDPLSLKDIDLFPKFARWFDTQEMETPSFNADSLRLLDTERNAEAALSWARTYGVLGLGRNPNEIWAVGSGMVSSSTEITARLLGQPPPGGSGARAYKMSPRGGEHETVERFVEEAREANVILKIYEAATSNPVDVSTLAKYMSEIREVTHLPKRYRQHVKSELEEWSETDERARKWATIVVEETVARKVENDVYPLLNGSMNSFTEAWGFKSLLGGMWLQMRNFMQSENNRCAFCNEPFVKTRRDKRYCSEVCASRARAKKSYELKKQRADEAREESRRRRRIR